MSNTDHHPADEKVVAEFKRLCRFGGAFDGDGPCCCAACDHNAMLLVVAARIRAEAEREGSERDALLRDIRKSLAASPGITHVADGPNDPREVETGEMICGGCGEVLPEHHAECFVPRIDRALAAKAGT